MHSEETNLYRELQIHLDKLPIGFPKTESGVEIKILKNLFTEEEVKLALCLTLSGSNIKKINKRLEQKFNLKLNNDEIEQKLDKLFNKGSIERSTSNKNGIKTYSNAMLAIGMFEFQVDHLTKEFTENLYQYLDEGFGEAFFSSSKPQLRTSPHLSAVIPEHLIDTYDNMKEFVTNTTKSIQVANCVCKQGSELIGKPCKQVDNLEICIMFDAESFMERHQARTISKEDCLKLLDYAEKKGLVLQPGNTYEPFCVCLCCGCCCGVLTTAKKFPKPAELFATNYVAKLDSNKCTGCGVCIKRCQMDALTKDDHKNIILDLDKCIGCGLCVTTCKPKSIKLEKKKKTTVPPKNIVRLYLSILKNKVGKKKMILNMLKLLLGKQM